MKVYDVQTGEALECEPVDAKELIASKAYRAEQEEPKPAKRGRKAASEE